MSGSKQIGPRSVTSSKEESSNQLMDLTEEEQLIAGILRDDRDSVMLFIRTYQDQVYAHAHKMLRNTQDAEEACQDILMKALRGMSKFQGKSKLSSWLYRVTYTTCLDVIKKRGRRPAEVDIDDVHTHPWDQLDDALSILASSEQQAIVDQCISRLNETEATLIDLFHLQELSLKEMADITGMTEGSMKVRLHRSRKKLAVLLQRSLPSEAFKI